MERNLALRIPRRLVIVGGRAEGPRAPAFGKGQKELPMPLLFGAVEVFSADAQELLKLSLSGTSLIVTAYFWFVRANRERVSLGIFPVAGFEGSLEPGGVGLWAGQIILTNRSILPTAVIAARAELWWNGRWITGNARPADGSELPWNLPPSQAFSRCLSTA